MADIPQAVIDTLIAEAAGEGPEGMRRVAETILNRAAIRGLSPEQVVTQRAQYTGYSQPGPAARQAQSNAATRAAAEAAFRLAMEPGDPTNGADHYYAPGTIGQPRWAASMTPTGEYGGHAFFASRPIPPGEIPNVVASLTDTVPPAPPAPVTMSPDLSLLRNPRMSVEARSAQVTPPRSPQPRAADLGLTRTNPVTPRLTDTGDDIYSYHIPDITPTALAGGFGSLTPSVGVRPVPAQQSPQLAAVRSRDQGLQSILDERYPREATQYPPMRLPELPPSNLGQPPITRSVQSIPMNMPPTQAEIDRAPGQVIATIPTTVQPITSASANIRNQRNEQLSQRPPLIPDRLMPGSAAQNYDIAINGPPGLTREQFAALPGQTPLSMPSIRPRLAAPMPMPASMRPMAPVMRQATGPRPMPQLQRRTSSPLRIVVQGANLIPAPQNRTLVAATRGPSVEDRVSGRAYDNDRVAQSLSS